MEGLPTCGCEFSRFPHSLYNFSLASPCMFASFCNKKSSMSSFAFYSNFYKFECHNGSRGFSSGLCSKSRVRAGAGAGPGRSGGFSETRPSKEPAAYPKNGDYDDNRKQKLKDRVKSEFCNDYLPKEVSSRIEEAIPPGNSAIITACFIGLLTGVSVVLFNTVVHEIRDLCWDGIPHRGASWLREEPIEEIWQRVILVPACGGLVVGSLNMLRGALKVPSKGTVMFNLKAALEPILKTMAACVTLGTGNSLGPEGPSVEIGASIAGGVGYLFDRGDQRRLSLKAAGSSAGISSGFNAAVAGCFFAVESVLWPSAAESSFSLTNTTSMVILSAVIASVVTEIGLGSEPAFRVPEYDFRSPSELPLYLLLGALCGLVSLTLSRCTSFMVVTIDDVQKTTGLPKVVFPALGGLAVGFIALAYPEILYWGFENVDLLLESRPFVKGLSTDLLLQLVAVKILAASLSRASGLVGGYYAPSLFIGAATGMAYGKFVGWVISQSNPIFHLSFLEVASPQAYGLVGMAGTLAGVCQVPLTAVLLLFELTQDYRIVLPLLGAVGLSSWITSGKTRRRDSLDAQKLREANSHSIQPPKSSSCSPSVLSYSNLLSAKAPYTSTLGELGSSLCQDDSDDDSKELAEQILVSQAMRTRYVTVLMSTLLMEVVALMLAEKQSCAVIVDDNSFLIGLLTLGDIHEFSKSSKAKGKTHKELTVYDVCSSNGEKCQASCMVTPSMNLLSALTILNRQGMSLVAVVSEHVQDGGTFPVGLLDEECINLACRAFATKDFLC